MRKVITIPEYMTEDFLRAFPPINVINKEKIPLSKKSPGKITRKWGRAKKLIIKTK